MHGGILIWGAGAIGGTLGAYLIRAGQDVTFVDVVPEHVEAINNRGLSIEGPIDTFTVQANAFLPADLKGTWKRIFLAVKAQHTADAVFLNRIGFGLVSLLAEVGSSLNCQRYANSYFAGVDPDWPDDPFLSKPSC